MIYLAKCELRQSTQSVSVDAVGYHDSNVLTVGVTFELDLELQLDPRHAEGSLPLSRVSSSLRDTLGQHINITVTNDTHMMPTIYVHCVVDLRSLFVQRLGCTDNPLAFMDAVTDLRRVREALWLDSIILPESPSKPVASLPLQVFERPTYVSAVANFLRRYNTAFNYLGPGIRLQDSIFGYEPLFSSDVENGKDLVALLHEYTAQAGCKLQTSKSTDMARLAMLDVSFSGSTNVTLAPSTLAEPDGSLLFLFGSEYTLDENINKLRAAIHARHNMLRISKALAIRNACISYMRSMRPNVIRAPATNAHLSKVVYVPGDDSYTAENIIRVLLSDDIDIGSVLEVIGVGSRSYAISARYEDRNNAFAANVVKLLLEAQEVNARANAVKTIFALRVADESAFSSWLKGANISVASTHLTRKYYERFFDSPRPPDVGVKVNYSMETRQRTRRFLNLPVTIDQDGVTVEKLNTTRSVVVDALTDLIIGEVHHNHIASFVSDVLMGVVK